MFINDFVIGGPSVAARIYVAHYTGPPEMCVDYGQTERASTMPNFHCGQCWLPIRFDCLIWITLRHIVLVRVSENNVCCDAYLFDKSLIKIVTLV